MKKYVFSDDDFKKSSFSALQYPACVSVARDTEGNVAVRDSKDQSKATLYFNKMEWDAFIKGVKNNEFE
jgi:hypothetical protein